MSYQVDRRRRDARPRRRSGGKWGTSLVTLGVAGALAGVWSCVPRAPLEQAATSPVPAAGFVSVASAKVLRAPAPTAALAAPGDRLDRELRATLRQEEAKPAAESRPAVQPAAAAASPVSSFRISATHEMLSTGYCLKGLTRTGVRTRDGLAAADPDFLPLGSVVRLSFPDGRPLGVFVIMDTGGAVHGHKIDIYMSDCGEASRWGSKKVMAEVLDLGRTGD